MVFGLTLGNEGSLRDWIRHGTLNVTQGKNFDRSGSVGPWIVPAGEAGALSAAAPDDAHQRRTAPGRHDRPPHLGFRRADPLHHDVRDAQAGRHALHRHPGRRGRSSEAAEMARSGRRGRSRGAADRHLAQPRHRRSLDPPFHHSLKEHAHRERRPRPCSQRSRHRQPHPAQRRHRRCVRAHQRSESRQPEALLPLAFARAESRQARRLHGVRPRIQRHERRQALAVPGTLHPRRDHGSAPRGALGRARARRTDVAVRHREGQPDAAAPGRPLRQLLGRKDSDLGHPRPLRRHELARSAPSPKAAAWPSTSAGAASR